jgi:membrane protein YdbS with pleckstrin-like domain
MTEEDLLKNEKLEKILSPHPLSFMRYQSLCIFLLIWGVLFGWMANFSDFKDLFFNPWISILAWGIILMLIGIIASLITIRWRIFFMYAGVFLGGIGLILWQNWINDVGIFIPFYTLGISIIGFIIVELYRKSHKYLISNQRIIFKGGIITKEERTLRYDKISDINAKQGILGQIFGFGTIIPISQSGFGLGSDHAFAAGGVQVGEKKVRLMGLFGGNREVQTPRARSYYELHGVYPYKEIKKIVEEYIQQKDTIPYHQKNVEYQKEQSAFQKEQIDIQKQMRDLLKMQNGPKKNNKEKIDDEYISDEK